MSDFNIPVGSIIAYSGPLDTDDETAQLKALGWLPCDGSSYSKLDYSQLALSIGTDYGGTGGARGQFCVPDLRGRFVRGTSYGSNRDPDAANRTALNTGGNTGNAVGSLQGSASALPQTAFGSSTAGQHAHNVPHGPQNANAYALIGSHYAIWNSNPSQTDPAGAHTHSLASGWDAESRPLNLYVNFLIKYQDE